MRQVISAAMAAAALFWAGAASAATIVDYDDGVAGQTEGFHPVWTLVDDGSGGLAASTTRIPGKAHIALLFRGIQSGRTFTPTFGAALDNDESDKITDVAQFLDIIFPMGGYLGPGNPRTYYAPGERVTIGVAGYYLFAFADEIWIDNVVFAQTDVSAFVPEPSTWALMIIGFGSIGAVIRRRRPAAVA